MPKTLIDSTQIRSVTRSDLDVTTVGGAVVAKIIAGTGVTVTSTGADSGTGDVTINASGGSTPTGTGFTHITAGVQDGASKLVDVSSSDITGVLKASAFPAQTGDVTNSAGSLATTIANNAVTLAKMATQADQTILGNVSGGSAVPVALTAAQVQTMIGARLNTASAYITTDFTSTSTTFVDVTGMSFSIAANEIWAIDGHLLAAATNAKCIPEINGPASPTALWISGEQQAGGTNNTGVTATAYDTGILGGANPMSTARPVQIHGIISNGTNAGTVILRMKSSDGTSTGIAAGSYFIATRLH
jgi:hypothetical protein